MSAATNTQCLNKKWIACAALSILASAPAGAEPLLAIRDEPLMNAAAYENTPTGVKLEESLNDPTDLSDGSGSPEGPGALSKTPRGTTRWSTQDDESEQSTRTFLQRLSATYYAILYGPSVGSPSAYQPSANLGTASDKSRPIVIQNFVALGYDISDEVQLSATGYWLWQPVLTQSLTLRDPFIRLSHNSLISSGKFNLYADARVHLAVTTQSRDQDLLMGLQTFQIATYQLGTSRALLGLFGSARLNIFGSQGRGNDLELYLAPNVTYQLTDTVALTGVFEMAANHTYGEEAFSFTPVGTDFEPGLFWQITPSLAVNPYLTIPTSGRVALDTTTVGFMLNWQLF